MDPYAIFDEFARTGRMEQIADDKANDFVAKKNKSEINVSKLIRYLSWQKHCAEWADNIEKRATLVNKINEILKESFDGRNVRGNMGDDKPISSLGYIHIKPAGEKFFFYSDGKKRNAFDNEWIGTFSEADGSALWLADRYEKEAQKYSDLYISNFSLKPNIKFQTKSKREIPKDIKNYVAWHDFEFSENNPLNEKFKAKNKDRFPDKLKEFNVLGAVKEHSYENNEYFDHLNLIAGFIPKDIYQEAHAGLPLLCHDIMIEYNGGLLLVVRDNFPAKNVLWSIGGRLERGLNIVDSLKKKVKAECGLEIDGDLSFLGWERTYFKTEPFGHGHGTDTMNAKYFAKGKGELNLDKLHEKPTIIKPLDYSVPFRESLDPYMKDFMDEAMQLLSSGKIRREFLGSF